MSNNAPVMREIATTADGRDITIGYVDPLAVQPVRDPVLQLRGGGDYRIYTEVLRDDQVKTCFGQRQLAVIGKNWQVDAGGTSRQDKKAADFIREQLNNVGWDRVTNGMLYGVYYGFAVSEAIYARDGANVVLADIKVRNRRRFGFDGMGRLRMKTPQQPLGELLPERKFWAFNTGSDHDDDPYGTGLGHWLYWPAFFKRNGLKYWLLFLEKFGQPTAKGKYGPNATPEERAKLLQALAAISTDSGISIPDGMEIELIEAARSGTADYVSLYDRMDAAIAKVVLGQTASTQGTPGRLGNDDLQGDVRLDIIKADSDLVCESFNRSIVKWLVEWNFPGAMLPRVYRNIEPPEDLSKRADRDTKILTLGYKPTLQYIQQTYGDGFEEKDMVPAATAVGSEPADPKLKSTGPKAVLPGGGSVQQTALNGAQITALAEVIAQVEQNTLAPGKARALIQAGFPAFTPEQVTALLGGGGVSFAAAITTGELPPNQMLEQARSNSEASQGEWINQVKSLVDKAESLEQLQDQLLELYPELSLEGFASAMAQANSAAHLAGRNEVAERHGNS